MAKLDHSWQRGQNENANGWLGQYFPKSIKVDNIHNHQPMQVVDKLNSRSQKGLKLKTPDETGQKSTGINLRKLMGVALITWIQVLLSEED